MRSCVRSILVVMILGNASAGLAQEPDAGAEPEKDAGSASEQEPEDKHPRLVKPEGDREDNEQLGGEPSLTETKQEPAAKVEGEETGGEVAEIPPEECDLACIEAQLDAEEEKKQRKKGTLAVARESGSIGEDVTDDVGDALSAEPSTTSLAEAEVDVPDDRKLPMRLGPVRIKIGKTDDWIGIGFATQLEFEYDQQFAAAGFPKESVETLQFRRIRTTLSSSFIDGRIRSRFQINMTPSAFELIDMWFAFTRFKFATFRLGQFKIPYDRYRAQSFAALSLVDWAPTTRMFGSERQVGAEMLGIGGFLKAEYSIGIFSGTNARAAHGVGITEVYGEVPGNASNFGGGDVVSEFHPELVGRAAKNFGKINTDTNSDVTGSQDLRHSLGFGIAWDARPKATEDLGLRLSAEWLGKIRHIHMNVVSYIAWYKPWQGGKLLYGPMGFMAETGYRFSLMWELALRYSMTYLTPWLRSDARSYGAFQIASATDPADMAAAQEQYGQNGAQTTNNELALAGTSHVIGNSLKVLAEAAWMAQRWEAGRRNAFRINLQFQLLF
ncbi:MAG: OprO/OprP family phosphate-selective porin [Myxococcales bacterium]|nr:OprO/OprP family phosphate-selective porin [Myxococcales bacterium]